MNRSQGRVVLVLLCFFFIETINFCLCDEEFITNKVFCRKRERQALLSFKQSLRDPSDRLSSWGGSEENCCRWMGVGCDNSTSHVIGLCLRNPYVDDYEEYQRSMLGGALSPSLLELKHLHYLDLSWNGFEGIRIPDFLGSITSLRYLNLSNAGFGGMIPHHLGNLSSLLYLNLETVDFAIYVDNLGWLSHLTSLRDLDMGLVDLHKESNWLQLVNMLPSLSELRLSDCQLDNIPASLPYVNFTSLAVLDISSNNFNYTVLPSWFFNLSRLIQLDLRFIENLEGQIPDAIRNLTSLEYLDMSYNFIQLDHLSRTDVIGFIPGWIGQLKNLKYLYLSRNSLNGPIPPSLGDLSSLRKLYLDFNKLNGTLPESIGQLSHLETLCTRHNNLEGVISDAHFAKLSSLKHLDLPLNLLSLNVNSDWVPPFQLEELRLRSCKLGPRFPTWIRTQKSIVSLDLSETEISDKVPNWFWALTSQLEYLNVSKNQINGEVSNVLLKSRYIDLSINCFTGQLPRLSPNVTILKLSENSLSGPLSPLLCDKMDRQNKLEFLDLSENVLSGELSNCWIYWKSLKILNLESNILYGKIPSSMSSSLLLESLHLGNNSFSGELPSSLQDCMSLVVIDLGENNFSGNIPSWIGEKTTGLVALRLRSNKFTGNIPPQICHLADLRVLDLSQNSLSGTIPNCLNNVTAMTTTKSSNYSTYNYYFSYGGYKETLLLVIKGREWEYRNNLNLVLSIDLSCNNLSGAIPNEISSLSALGFLNLSRNHLLGKIPESIGSMQLMESLDLSRNHLSGEIPQSMSNLTFLNHLNLSHNNFSGRIPSSTQLQTFDQFSYNNNGELCGAPLLRSCSKGEKSQGAVPVSADDGEESEMVWFYMSMGLGFVMGFWGVCGPLLFKKTWRHAYFQFLNNIKDQLYVATTLKLTSLQKKFKKTHVDG